MTAPECTACHGGADYQVELRHSPTPFFYCDECKAVFMKSLDNLSPYRRTQVLSEMTFTPINWSKPAQEVKWDT